MSSQTTRGIHESQFNNFCAILWLLRIRYQMTTHQWLNRSVFFFFFSRNIASCDSCWMLSELELPQTSVHHFGALFSPLHLPICIPLSWFYMYLYKIKVLNNLFNIFLKNLYKVYIPTVNIK